MADDPTAEEIQATVAALLERKRSYLQAFASPASQLALIDLASFCKANVSCFVPGDRDLTLILEGRREVWLRIQQHLNLTPEQMFMLFAGNPIKTGEENA